MECFILQFFSMAQIRKIIEEAASELTLKLPAEMQGKQLEVIISSVDTEAQNFPRRKIGVLKGQITVPESFFEPLPESIQSFFE